MHLFLMARGINQSFEIWKMFMQTQWFDWRQRPILKDEKGNFIKDENGKYKYGAEKIVKVQGALRPIQLFEYVFPQESLQEVLAMMDEHKSYCNMRPDINVQMWALRKMLNAKKIPEMPDLIKKEREQVTQKSVPHTGVAIYPIGIKEDPIIDLTAADNSWGFNQEGL